MAKEHKGAGSSAKPHHMHALTKASATHLLNGGHIDREQHGKIVKHAERGMKQALKARGEK